MEEFKKRLLTFIEAHYGISVRSFEEMCGITNGTIGSIKVKGPSVDVLLKISYACPEINLNWLVTGKGAMLLSSKKADERIPILPFSAVAGWLDGNNSSPSDEYMSVPDFSDRHADYVIRVSGDSMSPKYNGGDLLAIRRLVSPSFFQWGKVYVLNTTQGCIIKRLFPDPEDGNSVICHSENNEKYPDYKIAKEEILGVAIVVGYVGLE